MTPQSKTYTVTNLEKVEAKFEQLHIQGVDFTQPKGEVVFHACTLEWSIVGSAVTVTVVDKPIYISWGEIWNRLGEAFNGAV